MATFQTYLTPGTTGSPTVSNGYRDDFKMPFFKMRRTINYKNVNRAANDIDEVFRILAGTFVLAVFAKVVTVEGGTLTFDVGDGATVDGYIDGANGNTLGYAGSKPLALAEGTPNTLVEAFADGKLYTADDTIDIKVIDAADAAVIALCAIVMPVFDLDAYM
jgi:hypothetical protein